MSPAGSHRFGHRPGFVYTHEVTLDQLLAGKSPEAFSAEQLSSKAFWRLDRKQYYAAYLLFEAAWRRAEQTGVPWRAERNRAATSLFEAGHVGEALPLLHAILDDYAAHPEAVSDRHWVEHTTQCLLRHAYREDPNNFETRYRQLTARAAALQDRESPWIHPFQEELAEFAQSLGCRDVVRELVATMARRKPMPRALKAHLRELRAWLDD